MSMEMPAGEVIAIINLLNQHGIEVVVDGGWGVDALLGRQMRTHEDLDVAVAHKDVPLLRQLMAQRGYNEIPRDDTWECNFVLQDSHGCLFDVHSFTFDEEGNHVFGVKYPFESLHGQGSIAGQPVRCITPEWMVKFHSGYTLDEDDYFDVKALCEQYGIALPAEYDAFDKPATA